MSEFKAYLVHYPQEYWQFKGWKFESPAVMIDGISYGATSRVVTSDKLGIDGFDEAAQKFIGSIRDTLHGWRDVGFDRFALQIQWHGDSTAKVYMVDSEVDIYIAGKVHESPYLTKEFFARRGEIVPSTYAPYSEPKYVRPEDKTIVRKKTTRGSIITIIRDEEQDLARIEVTDVEDMMKISSALGKAGIAMDVKQGVSKHTWEDALPQHKRVRGPMSKQKGEYPGLTIYFLSKRIDKVLLSITPLLAAGVGQNEIEGEYKEIT